MKNPSPVGKGWDGGSTHAETLGFASLPHPNPSPPERG